MDKKGSALLVVLTTLLFLVFLAIAVIQLISSQARLTHHQVSRIQGYYAAQAGVNLALEKLRLDNDASWPNRLSPLGYNNVICNTVRPACPNVVIPGSVTCSTTENFPCSVLYVTVTVGDEGSGIDSTRPVSAITTYTYTPTVTP